MPVSRPRVHRIGICSVVLLLLASPALAQPSDPAARAARARDAMQARRFDEAVTLYAGLVRDLPDEPGIRLNLGIALHSAERYDAAAEELERVVARDPSMAPAWLMLGVTRLKLGQPDRAVPALQRVVDSDPANSLARIELADAHLQLGQFRDAASQFDKATELDPRSTKAWLGTGRSYTAVARQSFEELERAAPGSAYWAALLARSKASQQQYRSAFQLYRQALERAPALRGVHSALSEIYRRTGHPDWAAEEERREAELPPLDCETEPFACGFAEGTHRAMLDRLADARTPEALYWRSLGASELAREAFARLDAMPASPESHALRAEAHRIRGLHKLSIEELRKALRFAPEDRELRRQLAESLWLNGDYEEARPMLEALRNELPESPTIAYQLGDTLLQLQRPDEAIPLLASAVERAADHHEARAALARALVRMGEWRQAIPHLEATRERDEDGSLHVLLARAYAATGSEARSTEAMRRAAELQAAAAARRAALHESSDITAP